MSDRDTMYGFLVAFPVFFLPKQLIVNGVFPELGIALFVLLGSVLVFLATRRRFPRGADGTYMTLFYLAAYASTFSVFAVIAAHMEVDRPDGLLIVSYAVAGIFILLAALMAIGALMVISAMRRRQGR